MHRLKPVLLALSICLMTAGAKADVRNFSPGATVTIKLNWNAFVANGFSSTWQVNVENAIINGMTRWVKVASPNLFPRYGGLTTAAEPAANEILVTASEAHFCSGRGASTVGTKIVFHRKWCVGGDLVNWVQGAPTADGQIDFTAFAIHELGHAMGFLDDLPDVQANWRRTMNGFYDYVRWRAGPMSGDVAAMRALYGVRSDLEIGVALVSTNNGANYSVTPYSCNVPTNEQSAAVRNGSSVVLYSTSTGKTPQWRSVTTTGACGSLNSFFGGERSAYGVGASGIGSEMMWAWVDFANDNANQILVVRSTDGGASWGWTALATGATTMGTPALKHLTGNTWALAYNKLSWDGSALNTSDVILRVTTNDGGSWGPEVNLSSFYSDVNAIDGVSLTARVLTASAVEVWVDFSGDPPTDPGAQNFARSIVLTVDPTSGGVNIFSPGTMTGGAARTRAFAATGRNVNSFVRAYVATNDTASPGPEVDYQRVPIGNLTWSSPLMIAGSLGIDFVSFATSDSQSDIFMYITN